MKLSVVFLVSIIGKQQTSSVEQFYNIQNTARRRRSTENSKTEEEQIETKECGQIGGKKTRTTWITGFDTKKTDSDNQK